MKGLLNFITLWIDTIYLSLSDCDGMCNHCSEELKKKCHQRKNIYPLKDK